MLTHHSDFDGHEKVIFCHDSQTNLRAIIAIHSTALGPAAGGCRMYPYESEEEALTDVLRLSKGMTYKNSVAGLPLGGGKSVIIGNPHDTNKKSLLKSFAKHVQSLKGNYWTAVDIGVNSKDADLMAEECDYIFARASQYEDGFNPSSFTTYGGFIGIQSAVKTTMNRNDLNGIKVAVQGLGATGFTLCKKLHEAGAQLVVSDVKNDLVNKAKIDFGAQVSSPDNIHSSDVDVFSPCAMGAGLNDKTIPEIKAKIICGLANNQLAENRHGKMIKDKKITYVPDYVVNAGGMMGASTVIFTEPSMSNSLKNIEGLRDTISKIIKQSQEEDKTTVEIADKIAEERIKYVKISKGVK
jgi:leucine dehydrogenase